MDLAMVPAMDPAMDPAIDPAMDLQALLDSSMAMRYEGGIGVVWGSGRGGFFWSEGAGTP